MHLRERISQLLTSAETLASFGWLIEERIWRSDMARSMAPAPPGPVILTSPDRRVVGRFRSGADALEFKVFRPHWTEVREIDPETGEALT